MGTVFNIQRFCLHDGDGIRTTVFFKGCPLRCIWCHNPEGFTKEISVSYNDEKCTLCGNCTAYCRSRSIEGGKINFNRDICVNCGKCVESCVMRANELIGEEMTADEVIKEVLKDKIYYHTSGGGMTLSGGEPSMQPDFAIDLIEKSLEHGVSAFVETCGIGSRDFYSKLLDLGVVFLFDIKCVDSVKHKALTGVDNERILSNLLFLFENNADMIIRLPMIPGINDSDDDIADIARLLKYNEGKFRYAEIMPYHSYGTAKAKRLGLDDAFECHDATVEDKLRWKKKFFENGIDISVPQ